MPTTYLEPACISGFEFFGGTVNAKFLSSLFSGDDGIDVDQGYQGSVQFALIMTGSQGHRALEIDSSHLGATLNSHPRSSPRLQSMTLMGGGHAGRASELMLLRRGAAGSFSNLVFAHPPAVAIRLESCGNGSVVAFPAPAAGGIDDLDDLRLSTTSMLVVAAHPSNATTPVAADSVCQAQGAASLSLPPSAVSADAFASVPDAQVDFDQIGLGFDPLPKVQGSLLCRVGVVDSHLSELDSFFEPVACAGAFPSPGSDANWLKGWSILDGKWLMPSPPPPSPTPSPPTPSSPPPDAPPSPMLSSATYDVVALVVLCVAIAMPCLFVSGVLLAQPTSLDHYQKAMYKPGKSMIACRRITKPFYRWCFLQGRRFTDESIAYFEYKYIRKYVVKRQKVKVDEAITSDEVMSLVRTVTQALHDGGSVIDALLLEQAQLGEATRHAVALYATGLHKATCTNVGLSHAKAREYWIYRGPRQLFTTGVFIGLVLVMNDAFKEQSLRDRAINIATSFLALLTAFVMLYYRLPDSIRASVCRSAHDYYVTQKKSLKASAKGKAHDIKHEGRVSWHSASSLESNTDGSPDPGSDVSEEGYGLAPRPVARKLKTTHSSPAVTSSSTVALSVGGD